MKRRVIKTPDMQKIEVTAMSAQAAKALHSPDLGNKLLAECSEIGGMPPDVKIGKWTRVVKTANIVLQ